jgi:hypothetical protein
MLKGIIDGVGGMAQTLWNLNPTLMWIVGLLALFGFIYKMVKDTKDRGRKQTKGFEKILCYLVPVFVIVGLATNLRQPNPCECISDKDREGAGNGDASIMDQTTRPATTPSVNRYA